MNVKRLNTSLVVLSLACSSLFAAAKTYQVTGTVKALRPDAIVVDKGKEVWEVGRDAASKVTGDLKVGAKVTIEYRMTATTVTVKAEGAPPKPAPAPKKVEAKASVKTKTTTTTTKTATH